MKRTALKALVVGIAMIFGSMTRIYAWQDNTETWGPITRAMIESIANDMINSTWRPPYKIENWQCGDCNPVRFPFYQGILYNGVAYSQVDPQQTRIEFENSVATTKGGPVAYGNDCSGFASMAWKLPRRYNTTKFDNDATNAPTALGDYVTSRGAVNSAPYTILLSGDALVRSAYDTHMVLFKHRTTAGIMTMEQTTTLDPLKSNSTPGAKSIERKWSQLPSYRPIRRNWMDEILSAGSLPSTGSIAYPPYNTYFYSGWGITTVRLGGPNNSTNFDLYLWKWNGSSWQVVASSAGSLSSEAITYSGSPGYYYCGVYSRNGSGSYEVSIKFP